jgi:hypothetical protein
MTIPQERYDLCLKNICEYCDNNVGRRQRYWDNNVERRQRKLWESIKTRHYSEIYGGPTAHDCLEEHTYEEGDIYVDIYVENKEGIQYSLNYMDEGMTFDEINGLKKIIYNNDNLPSKKGKRNYSPFTLWKSIKLVKKNIAEKEYMREYNTGEKRDIKKVFKSEWKLMKGNTEKEKLDIWIASHKNCNYRYEWEC